MSRSRFILQQSKMQARLFASLASRRVDAKEFIRAFMNSRAAEGLDAPYDRMQWAGEEYIYKTVVQEAGRLDLSHPQSVAATVAMPCFTPDTFIAIGII